MGLYDSVASDSARQYHFDRVDYVFGFRASYKILDNLIITGDIPIIYSSLDENYERDSNGLRQERASFSLTRPLYYSLGAIYGLARGSFYSNIGMEIKIPPGFHYGAGNDPGYDYLGDGAFETAIKLAAGFEFEKSWLEGSVLYNYRDEEFADELHAKLEYGVSSVEDTYIRGVAEYVFSLGNFPDSLGFDIRKLPLREEYLKVGAAFYILISDLVSLKLEVAAKLFGSNTWLGGSYRLTAGLKL